MDMVLGRLRRENRADFLYWTQLVFASELRPLVRFVIICDWNLHVIEIETVRRKMVKVGLFLFPNDLLEIGKVCRPTDVYCEDSVKVLSPNKTVKEDEIGHCILGILIKLWGDGYIRRVGGIHRGGGCQEVCQEVCLGICLGVLVLLLLLWLEG